MALVERHAGPALVAEAWPALERWLNLLPPAAAAAAGRGLARAWVAQRRARWDALPALLTEAQALLDGGARPAAPADRAALERELDALTAAVRFGAGDLVGARAAARAPLAGPPPAGHHARGLAVFYAALGDLAAEGAAARAWAPSRPATGAGPAAGAAYDVAGALLGVGWGQSWPGGAPRRSARAGPAGAGPAGAAGRPVVGARPAGRRAVRVGPPPGRGGALRGGPGGARCGPA